MGQPLSKSPKSLEKSKKIGTQIISIRSQSRPSRTAVQQALIGFFREKEYKNLGIFQNSRVFIFAAFPFAFVEKQGGGGVFPLFVLKNGATAVCRRGGSVIY